MPPDKKETPDEPEKKVEYRASSRVLQIFNTLKQGIPKPDTNTKVTGAPALQSEFEVATTQLSQSQAFASAENRFAENLEEGGELSAEQYKKFHEEIMLTEDDIVETVGKHFMRAHISDNPGPKPLVILFLGNGENLRDETRGHIPEDMFEGQQFHRGMTHLYDEFSGSIPSMYSDNQDVIIFRAGDIRTNGIFRRNPLLTNQYAYAIAKNVIEDALHGRGIFEGQQYSSVLSAGYSHGGGFQQEITRETTWQSLQKDPEHPLPLIGSVSLDPIEHEGDLNAQPIRERSEVSESHLQVYQSKGSAPAQLIPIAGAPAVADSRDPESLHFNLEVANHRRLTNVGQWGTDNLFHKVTDFMREKQINFQRE